MVLQQRVEEEVEGVGEISPSTPEVRCELHNQTMTVTTLAEAS